MDENLDCDETINCVLCFQQDNLFSLWHNLKDVNLIIMSLKRVFKYRTKDVRHLGYFNGIIKVRDC